MPLLIIVRARARVYLFIYARESEQSLNNAHTNIHKRYTSESFTVCYLIETLSSVDLWPPRKSRDGVSRVFNVSGLA